MNIFNPMTVKKYLDQNKLEEAKKYLKNSYFPTENNCYIRFNIQTQKPVLITKEDLIKSLPSDLNNLDYLDEKKIKYSRSTKWTAKDYLTSCEFLDLDNIVLPIVDLTTTNVMIEKTLTKNNWRFLGENETGEEIKEDVQEIKQKYINMAESLPFRMKELADINLDDYNTDISKINKHLFEVLCSSDGPQYEYILNFLAFTVVGHTVETALYIQSSERCGKGIFFNFLHKMLGNRMYKTSSTETILKYNKPFEGRVLLNFDELPQSKDDTILSDKLKTLITEPFFRCRDIYAGGYDQDNTFNIIITTNNNAVSLTSQNNQRYVCLDVSKHRQGDTDYFNGIAASMNKPNVKKAYYKYLLERYEKVKGVDMTKKPESQTRNEKLTISMPTFMRYIKEYYILKNSGLNIKCTDLISHYNEVYKKNVSGVAIHRDLKKINIVKKRVKSKETNKLETRFIAPHEQLHKIFVSNHWLVEEFEDVEDIEGLENDDDKCDVEQENQRLKKELEKLHKQAEENTDEIDEYFDEIQEREEEIRNLKKELEQKSALFEATNNTVTEETNTIETKTKTKTKPTGVRSKVIDITPNEKTLDCPKDVYEKI